MNNFNTLKEKRQLKKEIQLNCPTCQTIYQLLEIQQGNNEQCADKCLKKWQVICHEHYQEKVLGYLQQQEFAEEKNTEELGIKVKKK